MTRNVTSLEQRLRQSMVRSIGGVSLRVLSRLVYAMETRARRSLPIDRYCTGRGIEIGAAASPAIVPLGTQVRYVDKYEYAEIAKDPELVGLNVVVPDYVCSAEKLETIADASQDFVLAFSLLEHVQDPIGALQSFIRVTRSKGTVILSVPDKRKYSPDQDRPLTSFAHLVRDHEEGPDWSRADHFRESAILGKKMNSEEADLYVAEKLQSDGHTHFHVWDPETFLDFLVQARGLIRNTFEILEFSQYGHEALAVLRVL